MSDLKLDVDQAGELKAAFRREGPWTNEEIKVLCERKGFLTDVRNVLLGNAEIRAIEHLIDCDADPFIPSGWSVEEHQRGGKLKFSPAKVRFYLSGSQSKISTIEGNKLRKELSGMPVLNADVLDHLLANPLFIPENWKRDNKGRTRYIFFWGTIYRDLIGRLCVRCLCWGGDRWSWACGWLARDWSDRNPVALLAS